MWACKTSIAVVAVQSFLMVPTTKAEKVRMPVALEGYIRDTNGKPVEGVLVMASEGSVATQGETAVIPIISPKVVGAVVIDDPNAIQIHDYNTHFTKTNSRGYYVFKTLSPGSYHFAASGRKKYVGDFRTHTNNLVAKKGLLAKYKFPPGEAIRIKGGETLVKDIVLQPSKLTAVCSVPRPLGSADAKFINGFAAKAGQEDPQAMLMIGYAYRHGQHGVVMDPAQAACWFRRVAAKDGDWSSRSTHLAAVEAKRELAKLHETIY
jgi:hypothetical protein